MIWILTTAGVLLVLLALRDIFHTLWHPGGFGTISHFVFASTWRLSRAWNRRAGSTEVAGPLGLLFTLLVWTLLLVVGFALVYLPRMSDDFFFGSSLTPARSPNVVESLYLSLVALTTLGIGDIQPATTMLRLVVPAEALVGFLLLTAGISWILQLYPALGRRRSLARRLTTMARHGTAQVVETGEASIAVQHLEAVRVDLAVVEVDLLQYGESYYFRETEAEVSFAAALPHVVSLVEAGERSSSAEVRNAAAMLRDGLGQLLALLRRGFLGDAGDDGSTLAALARDHQQPGPGGD